MLVFILLVYAVDERFEVFKLDLEARNFMGVIYVCIAGISIAVSVILMVSKLIQTIITYV
jgi:hypothetical protein